MRSEMYATHYRVGSWRGMSIYWHPAQGFAVEMDHQYLRALQSEAVDEIEFFDREEDYAAIIEAAKENAELVAAMPRNLLYAMADHEDDCKFAEQCERERSATLRQESGVY